MTTLPLVIRYEESAKAAVEAALMALYDVEGIEIELEIQPQKIETRG